MNSKIINLSSSGLKNLVLKDGFLNEDFYFAFGEEKITMSKILAEFISPKVSQLCKADPTTNSIYFEMQRSNILDSQTSQFLTKEIISLIQKLSSGYSIEIEEKEIPKLRIISMLFGNDELLNKINEISPFDLNETNFDQFVQYITFSELTKQASIFDSIAKNFNSIDAEKLLSLPKKILYSIISNPNFQIKSEDSLFEFIQKKFSKKYNSNNENEDDLSIIDFYEKVEFSCLSENKFREFIENLDFNDITSSLWSKLIQCFFMVREKAKVEFIYDGNSSNRFKGIIHYLTEKSGGNVDENNIVKVTASSVDSGTRSPKCSIDLENVETYFISKDQKGSWLKYDFIDKKIRPNKYSIRTKNNGDVGGNHIKNWVIEGSNTDRDDDWKILDSHTNDTSLNYRSASQTFDIKESLKSNEYYRYIRIRSTGVSNANNYYLAICALEYFGLIES
ncbi:hypothetical protein M9Y10_042414 [Tritrichomonas musculus]|uniref:F5/8 type C domain-containing protein n=1 Tax=Tritrichomonas musculus TaxID=1915356 RepID=A0ABR2GNK4_9EUKA